MIARFSAFEAARDAILDGEEDRGGAEVLGGGGKVILLVWLLSELSGAGYSSEGEGGTRLSCSGRLGTESSSIEGVRDVRWVWEYCVVTIYCPVELDRTSISN